MGRNLLVVGIALVVVGAILFVLLQSNDKVETEFGSVEYQAATHMAKSQAALFNILQTTLPDDDKVLCPPLQGKPIAENAVFDANGVMRSYEDIHETIMIIMCELGVLDPIDLFYVYIGISADAVRNALDGRDVPISDQPSAGAPLQEFQGSKRSYRAVMAIELALFVLVRELNDTNVPEESKIMLGSDPCSRLREWALSAPTFELRWAAYFTLETEYSIDFDSQPNYEPRCLKTLPDSENALLELARDSDLSAAAKLGSTWSQEYQRLVRGSRSVDELEPLIDDVEQILSENAADHPLIAMAAISSLSALYLREIELERDDS